MRRAIPRERLLRILRRRFELAIISVNAGAGFGKSTLIRQVVADGLISPRGIDVVVNCTADDRSLSVFATQLRTGLEISGTPLQEVTAEAAVIVAAMSARSPVHTALVLDDVHLLEGSGASALLVELANRLPSNGHLVLFGRRRLEMSTARALSQQQSIVLDSHDLSFTESEWNEFVGNHGDTARAINDSSAFSQTLSANASGAKLGGSSGNSDQGAGFIAWPALAELRRTYNDPSIVDEYVWAEVLNRLPPMARQLLALLSVTGGGDDARCRQLIDLGSTEPASLLSEIPLVRHDRFGWWPHDLWTEHLQGVLTVEEVQNAQRNAGLAEFHKKQYVSAFRLAGLGGDVELQSSIVKTVCERMPPLVARDVLDQWENEFCSLVNPPVERRYLTGKRLADSGNTADGIRDLHLARAEYESAGDLLGERNAIVDIAVAGAASFDIGVLAPLIPRVVALAQGGLLEAQALLAFGLAMVAESKGDLEGAISAYSSIKQESGSQFDLLKRFNRASLYARIGKMAEAQADVAVFFEPGAPSSYAYDVRYAFNFLAGKLEEAASVLEQETDVQLLTFDSRRAVFSQRVGALEVFLGRKLQVPSYPDSSIDADLHVVACLRAAEDGDDVQALASFELSLGRKLRNQTLSRSLAMIQSVLTSNDLFADTSSNTLRFAGAFESHRLLVESLHRLRNDGVLKASPLLLKPQAWPAPQQLRPSFIPRFCVELALIASASGLRTEAVRLLGAVGQPATAHLRRLSNSPVAIVATEAVALRRLLPVAPEHQVQIRLLGPFEIELGTSQTAKSQQLLNRRQRARHLLAYLSAHESVTRTKLAADLWPELDEDSAANNLRVTLTFVLSALEPDRERNAPSCFIRQSDGILTLVDHEMIRIDLRELRQARKRAIAAEASGNHTKALQEHLAVVAHYGGAFLPDSVYEEWTFTIRDQTADVTARSAVRAAELYFAAGNLEDAVGLAERAIALDPYCEAAYRCRIAALLMAGDQARASLGFKALLAMLDDLGVVPDSSTSMLGAQIFRK